MHIEIPGNKGKEPVMRTLRISMSGPPLKVYFNCGYLLDIAKANHHPELSLELTSKNKPGVFRPICLPHEAFTAILMPCAKE
jgi:DNA polymerase III sliding clamp (beta) subunit (PCNA family)